MRKHLIYKISLCAVMAALSIVLDKVGSIEVAAKIKITFYALPLIVVGISNGVIYGLITGVVTGTVLQLTSPWGVGPTSVFWALAPIAWGTVSGAIALLFKNKRSDSSHRLLMYLVCVIVAALCANVLNSFAMYMETLLIRDTYYTVASILLDWPLRLLTMTITIVPYTLVAMATCEALRRAYKDEN